MPPDVYIGIDLGGTKILAIAAQADGKVLGDSTLPTPAHRGPDAVIDTICEATDGALAQAGLAHDAIHCAGIAAAGAIDADRGIVVHAPQLPDWHDVPLVRMFRAHIDVPTVIGNDANLAALAEQRFGAAKGYAHMLYVTVSTGIGGGIIAHGRLLSGAHGFAGEVGHISVQRDGRYGRSSVAGAVESLASGTALAQIAEERMAAGEASSMAASGLQAPAVFAAYRQGDALAQSVVQEGIAYLGAAMTAWVNIIDPAIVVIGGGLSNEWADYIAPAIDIMRAQAFAGIGKELPVVQTALGAEVGALGAVALAADAEAD